MIGFTSRTMAAAMVMSSLAFGSPVPQASSTPLSALSVLCSADPAACTTTSTATSTNTATTTTTTTTNTGTAAGSTATAACPAPPQGSVCVDPTISDPQCFNLLDLPDFIINWWNANQDSCQSLNLGFADCWYAKETPYTGAVCGIVTDDGTCQTPQWRDFCNEQSGIQAYYVTYAIHNTYSWGNTMYDALYKGGETVSDAVGMVVTTLDPPKPPSTSPWEYVLDALTFGLSLYSEGSILVKAALRSLPQSSTVLGKVLFPEGEVGGDVEAWTDIQDHVGDAVTNYATYIGNTWLPGIQNDITKFIPYAQNAPVTGPPAAEPDIVAAISQSLNAYVGAAVINELGWVVARAEALSVAELQADHGSDLWYSPDCPGYDGSGICDSYFYDGQDTYSIIDPNNMFNNTNGFLETLIGGSDPLTTGNLLFTQALACSQTCGSNGGCAPSQDQNDPTQVSCISSLRICTWSWDTVGPFDAGCSDALPSTGQALLPSYGSPDCKGVTDGFQVPRSYLGGGIYENNPPGDWANQNAVLCNAGY